jgi:hypothetical protein
LRTGPSFCGNSHSWRDEEIYLYCNFRAPRPRRLRDGRIVRRILPHVVEQDASERLDGLFDEVVQAASARAAQGIGGLDETLDEMFIRVVSGSVQRSL